MQLVGNIFVVVSTDRDGLEVNNSKTFWLTSCKMFQSDNSVLPVCRGRSDSLTGHTNTPADRDVIAVVRYRLISHSWNIDFSWVLWKEANSLPAVRAAERKNSQYQCREGRLQTTAPTLWWTVFYRRRNSNIFMESRCTRPPPSLLSFISDVEHLMRLLQFLCSC